MGTSSSYPGPTGANPLLPPWAEPLPPEEPQEPQADKDEDPDQQADDNSNKDKPTPDGHKDASPQKEPDKPTPWRTPKLHIGRCADGKPNASYSAVGRSYVRASGGARSAATAASTGRSSTTRLGGFLADVAQRGFAEAARRLGLQDLAGKSAHSVLASLIDLIVPGAGLREEAAARKAMIETLSELFDRCEVEAAGLEALNSVSSENIGELVELSVANYVNERMQQELVYRVEQGTLDEHEANGVCAELRDFIVSVVRLDFKNVDLANMDWNTEGKRLIDRAYQSAYSLIGEAK